MLQEYKIIIDGYLIALEVLTPGALSEYTAQGFKVNRITKKITMKTL